MSLNDQFGLGQPSVKLKPDLLEFLSYREKIEYVRRIKNNQAFISYNYQNS